MASKKKKEKTIALPDLTDEQKERLEKAKNYAQEQTKYFTTGGPPSTIGLTAEALKAQQEKQSLFNALQVLSRVYVGNINYTVGESDLLKAFAPYGHIHTVSLTADPGAQRHKGFAFVEYDAPESALLALENMNGFIIGGRGIKVGRPNNAPQALTFLEPLAKEAVKHNRIFVASINPDILFQDIKYLFEASGPVKRIVLAPGGNGNGGHRGYGWVEYENADSVLDAIQSIHMLDLGERWLRVCKAVSPPEDALSMLGITDASLAPIVVPQAIVTGRATSQSDEAKVPQQQMTRRGSQSSSKMDLDDEEGGSMRNHEQDVLISGTNQRYAVMHKLAQARDQKDVLP